MDIETIRKIITKPVTKFSTGGFRPTNSIEESWIGKVTAFLEDEEIPRDEKGNLMIPLCQLYLPNLPFVHENVKETKLISAFVSNDFFDPLETMGKNWVIREYTDLDKIKIKAFPAQEHFLKPFPLKPEFVERDYPLWDGGGLSREMEEEVLKLEKAGVIECYYDIADHVYEHKIGGYPSFCQSGIYDYDDGFGAGFEFVFQISSDNKAQLNVVDSGSFMFAKNKTTGEWNIYYDFY